MAKVTMLLVYFGLFSKYVMYIVDLIINVRGILISMNNILENRSKIFSIELPKGVQWYCSIYRSYVMASSPTHLMAYI